MTSKCKATSRGLRDGCRAGRSTLAADLTAARHLKHSVVQRGSRRGMRMINSSCRKTEQSDIRKSQSSPGIASTLLPRTSSNTPELCQLSRRKAMLSGTAVVWMAITAPARAQANLEVLRALERRQQSLEPLRRGVRGLDELQGQLVVLGKLVDEALLAVEQNDDAPVASVFQGLQGELEDARSLPRELAVMLRCVRPSFDRFEGLAWTGASGKLLSTLRRSPAGDKAVLYADLGRAKTALNDIIQVVDVALADPRQLWSFCFTDD